MLYLTVDKGGLECIYSGKPTRDQTRWNEHWQGSVMVLPKDSIERLIGRKLTWKDKPFAFKKVYKSTPAIGH